MKTDSPGNLPSPEPQIVDSNGIPARAEEPPENVVEMPPQLERMGRIVNKGKRRAIAILFETYLDGPRVNLLLARIYSQMENAEREVNRLKFKDVERILQQFKDSRPAPTDGA